MAQRFNQTPEYAAAFERLRQNFTTTFMVDGPNMTMPEMAERLCEIRDKAAESDALRADLAAALAWGEAMREALGWYASDEAWTFSQVEGPHGDYGSRARAALSTPAPAALDALRRKVRDEALEEAAKAAETVTGPVREPDENGNTYTYDAAREDVAAIIRAMKEGEG